MKVAFFADINDNHNQKWLKLLTSKHSIILFTQKSNILKDQNFIEQTSVKIYYILPSTFNVKNIFSNRRIAKQINLILKEHQIEVIHSIYSNPYSFWAGLVENSNHIITTYGSDMLIDYNLTWKNPASFKQKITFYLLRKRLEKIFNNAKFITSTSIGQQNVIRQFVFTNSKLHITRTGVDCEKFDSVYKNITRQNKETVILSNRAMRPLYNIDIIVDAFCLLKKKYTEKTIKLVLLNYNTDELFLNSIKMEIQDNEITSEIEIINDLPFENLIQCYKNSDIVIMIPQSDGTPVTGVETLLAKKPLVMGNLNYDTDLFNEHTVWKLNKTDAKTLCEKLIEVLNTPSEDIRNKTENGYLAAQKHADVKSEIEKIERLYENIISE